MKITILGSGGSSISPDRSLPAILVDRDVLFDCGEGATQSLLRKLGSLDSLKIVFLTHLHSDHVSGLLGLIWAMWLRESRKEPLSIIGPEKTEETVMSLLRILNTPLDSLTFPLKFRELAPGAKYDNMVSTTKSIHNPTTLAYRFERDGASFCYTGDTAPSKDVSKLAKGCKLLIHDSAFPEEMVEKAKSSNHSTSVGAATVAKEAGVKTLVLFHWSSVNEGKEQLLVAQAKRVYTGNVILARDGLEISL
ncbi:MAG: ribonuclease Z [Promethearchaeati archaeon SRVP18_Atabeyarchaeia-1]